VQTTALGGGLPPFGGPLVGKVVGDRGGGHVDGRSFGRAVTRAGSKILAGGGPIKSIRRGFHRGLVGE
jgi:hypothetical protein